MKANSDIDTGKNSAVQHVFKVRRDYNTWVSNETLEDYALRFTPRSYRKWPEWQVANTAFSSASFLVLEAIGATLLVDFGFINTALAILAAGLIIFLVSLPVSRYSARYGVDMDLLTRGSGFGYLGSTITSLIYAAFTFIFFALEAAIMAYALKLAFDIPLGLGLSDLRAGGDPAGDPGRHGNQPVADADPAGLAGAAVSALSVPVAVQSAGCGGTAWL